MGKVLLVAPDIPIKKTNAGDFRIYNFLNILSRHHKLFFCPLNSGELIKKKLNLINDLNLTLLCKRELNDLGKEKIYDAVFFEFYGTALWFFKNCEKSQKNRVIIDSHCLKFIENRRNPAIKMKNYLALRREELNTYRKADMVLTVSDKEAEIVTRLTKVRSEKLVTGMHISKYIRNRRGRKNIIFIGCMKNTHNQDAIKYFVSAIFPLIIKQVPEAKFIIAGSYPPKEIRDMANKNVEVTGYVPDTGVYLSSSLVSVAPLRIGAGIKHKITESLAWGCPLVTTSVGAEGMELKHGRDAFIADTPEEFAEYVKILYLNQDKWQRISAGGYKKAKNYYSLELMEKKLIEYV